MISANDKPRHGKPARNNVTRLLWPLAGLGITIKILQQIQTLAFSATAAGPENVVNGVKTIMVNEALRQDAHVAFGGIAVVGRAPFL